MSEPGTSRAIQDWVIDAHIEWISMKVAIDAAYERYQRDPLKYLPFRKSWREYKATAKLADSWQEKHGPLAILLGVR